MKLSKYSEPQILAILPQAEGGPIRLLHAAYSVAKNRRSFTIKLVAT